MSGGWTSSRPGLTRTDTLWKALGKAAVLSSTYGATKRLILLTTDAPRPGTAGHEALDAVRGVGKPVHDVIVLSDARGAERLSRYANGTR